MVATFMRNDWISFNPPTSQPAPPVLNQDYENHFLRGTWEVFDSRWLYHFGSSEQIVFFSSGDVWSSEDEDFVDGENGKFGNWYIIDNNNILVVNNLGMEYSFSVTISNDIMTITDSANDSSSYVRLSNDSPYGTWTLVDYNSWIYFFGLSETITFIMYGNMYASEPGTWAYWWFDPEGLYNTIGVWDEAEAEAWYFSYYTYENGKYLVITDEDGDWLLFERTG